MDVKVSQAAVAGVVATLSAPSKERTEAEKEYDAIVASCVRRPGGHEQKSAPPDTKRLYTVTTIAASARFGGTRTPVICDSFDEACDIVESNAGDIFETTYKLVVVEAIVPNALYGGDLDERYWWKWEGSHADGGYVAIEAPEALADRTGFAVG